MYVSVLASGSKGNATFVSMDGVNILIDAGISATRIKKALHAQGFDLAELSAIFITHEHIDHVRGLTTLLKHYPTPLYARPATLHAIKNMLSVSTETFFAATSAFAAGVLTVQPFSIPHDAVDPVGYRIEGTEVCTLATDLGFVTASVQEMIDSSDVLILEANHDPKMLHAGSYPWHLKRRILSNRGHLSNADTAWALARMKEPPAEVFLAHLSEENNRPALARDTVQKILAQQGVDLTLHVAQPSAAVSTETILQSAGVFA